MKTTRKRMEPFRHFRKGPGGTQGAATLRCRPQGGKCNCLAHEAEATGLLVDLRNLSDAIVTVCPFVVERGALWARVHNRLATGTGLCLVSLIPDGVSRMLEVAASLLSSMVGYM